MLNIVFVFRRLVEKELSISEIEIAVIFGGMYRVAACSTKLRQTYVLF